MRRAGAWARRGIGALLGALPRPAAVALLAARRVRVTNWSLAPLLWPGDHVLVDERAFRRAGPLRGDLVLVAGEGLPERRLLKLVAGLPGERVELAAGGLWIGGRRLAWPTAGEGTGRRSWQLGPEEYFLLSYNLAIGTDSRQFGPVRRGAIRGRARFVYLPPARARWLPVPALAVALEPAPEAGAPTFDAGPA